MPYVDVEAYISMSDIDTEDLCEELEKRGFVVHDPDEPADSGFVALTHLMYEAQRQGRPIDDLLRQLYWDVIGRNV